MEQHTCMHVYTQLLALRLSLILSLCKLLVDIGNLPERGMQYLALCLCQMMLIY